MEDEKRKREMIKRLGRMEEMLSAGERKKIKQVAKEKQDADEVETAKSKKTMYEVGTTSYEITQRLKRMEELEALGRSSQSRQAKKDLWAKLSDQAKKRYSQ
ncbi:MAG: hypothetical protein V1875_01935 [Candidatus Altiarchaeota archaeon]